MNSTEVQIAKMQSDIEHLAKSFDEFKEDTKEFHKKQSLLIDEWAKFRQEFGGITKLIADLRAMTQVNTEWRVEHQHSIEKIIADREDTTSRIKDAIWKYGLPIFLAIGVSYIYNTNSLNHDVVGVLKQGVVEEKIK